MRAVVVGGGITGLAAAHRLVQGGHQVTLVESSNRLGGKIRTSRFAGRPVEEGPDAFLARVPAVAALTREVGLGGDLVSPAAGSAYLWTDGALKPLPTGLVLGVPVDFEPLAAAGILSEAGLARARQEPDLPGEPITSDVSIGELIARRFGPELQERLVDPLLGGINAGRTEELSIDVGAAQLAAVARRHGSLVAGLRAQREAAPPPSGEPVFWSVRGGLQRLVDALATSLVEAGVEVRCGAAVESVDSVPAVHLAGGVTIEADAVIITVPAFAAAPMLRDLSAEVARALDAIDYSSVALVTLAYRRDAVRTSLDGSGFLVPRPDGRLLTACSVFSNKWKDLADPDTVLLRASAGRWKDGRALDMDDADLVAAVHGELDEALGLAEGPTEVRVSRWVRSFPQFWPGHLERVAHLESTLARVAPRVALAGAALRGVGIPACVTGAQSAAEHVTA
ncbi:MAG: Protoporphyrinogen IX oxidase, aerobic, HemY [uncultured Acidimicrobiales bacterium]|uniref:Coproporphyrinogen III oxidase n=1 Tax=uncultured Acidimicrobiales bacterium TaxID=310071 RepID=A0A6J4IVM6_9ACTN|nr:MAG: Protoporphyrinogen IX oxidase, aerobic, HemY [uncultured Acidimicrobiales bacterium]